jgi:hypothetical protein
MELGFDPLLSQFEPCSFVFLSQSLRGLVNAAPSRPVAPR